MASPVENGTKINNHKTFSKSGEDIHPGFVQDPIDQQIEDIILGESIVNTEQGFDPNEFKCYLP